jgi:hypothetical protein
MKRLAAGCALVAILTGCGGGGAGNSDSTASASSVGTTGSAATAASPSGTSNAPQFVVVTKVDGAMAPGYPATGSILPAVTLNSGQELEITSSVISKIAPNLNGAVAAVKAGPTTAYKAVLAASSNTNATFTFTPTSAPLLSTSMVPVAVRAAQFQPLVPKVGDFFVYSEKDEQLDSTPAVFPDTTHRVNLVNADGSWRESLLNPNNLQLSTVELTKYGNRTAVLATTSNTEGCNAGGNKDGRFSPEEKLLDFPLFVNKTYIGAWLTTCGTIDSQAESMNAKVVGYEVITTPAGVFNTLRIDQTTIVTNSTNAAYLGKGYTQQVSLWFDPTLGRTVKYIGQRTYESPDVSRKLLKKATIELVSYVRQAGSAGNIEPITPANALLSSNGQPSLSLASFSDTGRYRCSSLTSAEAHALYLQGHVYLDRDHDGRPCETNDFTIENTIYSVPTTSTTTTTSVSTSMPGTSGSTPTSTSGQCYVNGYYRSDGIYVEGYYRSCSTTTTSGSTSTSMSGQCYVNGYYRSNGTYVQGYYRSC